MRKFLLFMLAATMFAACTQDAIDEPSITDNSTDTINATIADTELNGDDTRVELNDKKQTVWTKGDNICIFNTGTMKVYSFNGETGDRSGSFSFKESYTFTNGDRVFDNYYAIYLADYSISMYKDLSPAFFSTLPSVQQYKDHSYGLNTNAMLGSSKNGIDFEFINLFGYIRLSLVGDKKVKSISLTGNNGEVIAGQVHIHKSGVTTINNDTETEITLDCGNGIQLTDEPTEFYFTLIPQTLSKGITAVVTFTDGTIYPKSTSKSITIERNHIQPMACFDAGAEIPWQSITLRHTGTKVTAPQLYGSTAVTGMIYWGDDYMSDVNTIDSYVYDDGKEEHTITIKSQNATMIYLESCSGISEIDLTNF